jgi:hypothetical protein
MATAGYNTTVYIGGTPTTMTDEATTQVAAGPPQTFRINASTKRVIDPETPVVIRDQDTDDVTSDFTVDYLAGTVTSATGGYVSVTVSGKFIPLLAVAEGRSVSANFARAELDSSIWGEAYTKAILGKKGCSGDIVTLAPLNSDLDPGGGTRKWTDVFDNATHVLLDVVLIPTFTARVWSLAPSLSTKSDQAGLVESTITWRSINKLATDGTECGFSYFNPA